MRKILVPLIPYIISLITLIVLCLLSYRLPIITADGGITTYTIVDLPLVVVALLTCLSPLVTFRTAQPRVTYYGLHIYGWLLSLTLCYIFSENSRTLFLNSPLLPVQSSLFILTLGLAISLLLIVFSQQIMKLLGLLVDKSSVRSRREEPLEDSFHPYQAGYQSTRSWQKREVSSQEDSTGGMSLQSHSDEQPRASYPTDMPYQE